MLNSGTRPPSGVKLSCIELTAPQEAPVVTVANSAEFAMPKRASLLSMLPPAWRDDGATSMPSLANAGFPAASVNRRRPRRPGTGTAITASTAQPWRWSPTMPAEHVGQRRADREDQHHLDEVGERVGVFERMGRVGVEEASAVGAQHLDDFLGSHRALGDHSAWRPRSVVAFGVGAEVLGHALPDEEQPDDDRNRQQDVERDSE